MHAPTRKALIIEDTLSNVRLLEAKLLKEHFEVHVAFNGFDALAKLDEQQFDIVFLDIMLPDMDGYEVCRRIKRHAMAASVPVVMLTALDESADRVAGFRAGADDFFVKPVEDDVLFGCVNALMAQNEMAQSAPVGRARSGHG